MRSATTAVLPFAAVLSAALIAAAATAPAGSPASATNPAPAVSLLAAERALTSDQAALGVRGTFLRGFDSTAVIFHPGPASAREVYTALAPRPSRVPRAPLRVVAGAGGDLGWTLGAWALYPDSAQPRVAARGDYLTLWSRRPGGDWRVALDAGLPMPAGAGDDAAPVVSTLPGAPPGAARPPLADAEADFEARAAGDGLAAAIARLGDARTLVLRWGRPRLEGATVARDSLVGREGRTAAAPLASFTAKAGDLGYAYGTLIAAGAAGPDTSWYVHVWRRDARGAWRLAVDYRQPGAR